MLYNFIIKKSISHNIGFYNICFIILFRIVSIFLFYIIQSNKIKKKINRIIYAIKNFKLIKSDKNKKNKRMTKKIKTKKIKKIVCLIQTMISIMFQIIKIIL